MTWAETRGQLACTGRADEMVVDAWRPQHQRARQERQALAICRSCPLLERCRKWVLDKDDDPTPVMVVGGMTPAERRRRKFGNEACGTDAGWQRHRKDGQLPCGPCAAAHNVKPREWAANHLARKRQQEGAA